MAIINSDHRIVKGHHRLHTIQLPGKLPRIPALSAAHAKEKSRCKQPFINNRMK